MKLNFLFILLSLFYTCITDTTWKPIDDVSSFAIQESLQFATKTAEEDYPNYPKTFINAYYLRYFGDNYYFVYAVFNEKERELFFYLVFIEIDDDVGISGQKIYQKYVEKHIGKIDIHNHYYILFQPAVISYLYTNEKVMMSHIEDIQQYHNYFAIKVKTNNEYDYYLAGWKDVNGNNKYNDDAYIKASFKIKKQ